VGESWNGNSGDDLCRPFFAFLFLRKKGGKASKKPTYQQVPPALLFFYFPILARQLVNYIMALHAQL
jgi:hypothetical protein